MTELNDITDLFDFPLYYAGEQHDVADALPPALPPTLPSYSFSPELTPTEPTGTSSPVLSEEDNLHYDNLLWLGIDSAVLPPSAPTHMAEYSTSLAPPPPPFAPSPTLTNVSTPPADADPGPASPATCASPHAPSSPPQTRKRRRSLSDDPVAGPSARPATKPRLAVVPGESFFQLDLEVPAFTPNVSSGAPIGKTRQRVDYSACKCPNKSKKPARHWKTACPYNKNRSQNRHTCELCGFTFSRHDNRDRHIEDFHP